MSTPRGGGSRGRTGFPPVLGLSEQASEASPVQETRGLPLALPALGVVRLGEQPALPVWKCPEPGPCPLENRIESRQSITTPSMGLVLLSFHFGGDAAPGLSQFETCLGQPFAIRTSRVLNRRKESLR